MLMGGRGRGRDPLFPLLERTQLTPRPPFVLGSSELSLISVTNAIAYILRRPQFQLGDGYQADRCRPAEFVQNIRGPRTFVL